MSDKLFTELKACKICPHECGVDRYATTGNCNSTEQIKYNLHQKHFGEEPIFSGSSGSGTIFFSNCNLHCVFCQNWQISQQGDGKPITISALVKIMLELQNNGVHNINLVSPTHYTPQIREAIIEAKKLGLFLPVIWNSNGYESIETLKTLDGLVDIYIPDFKYYSPKFSKKYSFAPDYPDIALLALKEMYRQVGDIVCSEEIATRGMLVRHLVLPDDVSGSKKVLYMLHEEFGSDLYLSLMGQYYPTYQADKSKVLSKSVSPDLYDDLVRLTATLGFKNAYVQECGSSDAWTPKFKDEL